VARDRRAPCIGACGDVAALLKDEAIPTASGDGFAAQRSQ